MHVNQTILKIISALLIPVILFTSCSYKLVKTGKEYKNQPASSVGESILRTYYDNSQNKVSVFFVKKQKTNQLEREIKHYEQMAPPLIADPLVYILAGIIGVGVVALIDQKGYVTLVYTAGFIGAGFFTKIKTGKEKTHYSNWYPSEKKEINELPLSGRKLKINHSGEDNIAVFMNYPETLITDEKGKAVINIELNRDVLIEKSSDSWNFPQYSSLSEKYLTLEICDQQTGLKTTQKIGPFKNKLDKIINELTSTIKINVMDYNSQYPLNKTRITCTLLDNNQAAIFLKNKIKDNINFPNLFQQIAFEKTDKDYQTDNNGVIVIQMLKGGRYKLEFKNMNYYYFSISMSLKTNTKEIDVFLSSIASKKNQQYLVQK